MAEAKVNVIVGVEAALHRAMRAAAELALDHGVEVRTVKFEYGYVQTVDAPTKVVVRGVFVETYSSQS